MLNVKRMSSNKFTKLEWSGGRSFNISLEVNQELCLIFPGGSPVWVHCCGWTDLIPGICICFITPPKMDYLKDFTERLYLFSLAAITKHYILGGLKRLEFILSQFWKARSWNPGVSGPGFLQRSILPCLSPGFWWVPAVLAVCLLVNASLPPLPPSSCAFSSLYSLLFL